MRVQLEKIKKLFNKIFNFEVDSDYFLLIKYCDKIVNFDIFSSTGKEKVFKFFFILSCTFLLVILINELSMMLLNCSLKLTFDAYVDKFFMIIYYIFSIFRLIYLKLNNKSFLSVVDFLNGKKFCTMEAYVYNLRKNVYKRNNIIGIALFLIFYLFSILWVSYLQFYTVTGWFDILTRILFMAGTFLYYKGFLLVIILLLTFTCEFQILQRSFRYTFQMAKERPSSLQNPNKAIRLVLQENIEYYNEVLQNLDKVRPFLAGCFLFQVIANVSALSSQCYLVALFARQQSFLLAAHRTFSIFISFFETLVLCRLIDVINGLVNHFFDINY